MSGPLPLGAFIVAIACLVVAHAGIVGIVVLYANDYTQEKCDE